MSGVNLFPDVPKEEQKQGNGLLTTPKGIKSSSTSAESSPPTVRRKAIAKKDERSLDSDDDFFRGRSDSGFNQEMAQISSDVQ